MLEAVYGCYAVVWPETGAHDTRQPESLAGEARHLAVTLASLLGDEPEARGLATTITLSLALARAPARAGRFVPLAEQDPSDWTALCSPRDAHLRRAGDCTAARGSAPGRFQLEAAIQAVHCDRAVSSC